MAVVDGKILKASEDGQPQTLPAPPDGVLERAAVDDRGVVAAAMVETDGAGPSLATLVAPHVHGAPERPRARSTLRRRDRWTTRSRRRHCPPHEQAAIDK